jgi:uncharacterized phage protein (TIGR02218 family)
MRDLSASFQSHLDTGATTLCRCWKLLRHDGVAHGFTDHDLNVNFDGQVFEAGSGLDTSALETSTGLSIDNAEAVGALSAIGLTEEEISAGLFDRAEIWHWLVNWANPEDRCLLFRGFLGEIQRGKAAFNVELLGLTEALNRPVGRTIMRGCSSNLGDDRCSFDVLQSGYSVELETSRIKHRRFLEFDGLTGFANGWFTKGKVTWLDGAGAGHVAAIKSDQTVGDKRRVELWTELPSTLSGVSTVRLEAGCDKSTKCCLEKFNNLVNFRGFPHIPGEDWAAAYPASSDLTDGSSLFNE